MLGGVMVVVAIVVILMAHEGGHLVAAKLLGMKATKYFLGFGPTLWSFQRGETEYGIKAIPAGGYVRIEGMNALDVVEPEDEARAYRGKPFWQKSVVVMGGIGTHFVIAFVLLWFVNVVIGEPDTSSPLLEVALVIPETEDGSPSAASLAGVLPGDRIVAVNGRPVDRWSDLSEVLRSSPNRRVELDVLRDGAPVRLTPTLTARTDTSTGEEVGFLGVSPRVERERDNPILGVGKAAGDVALYTRLSVQGIWLFATNLGNPRERSGQRRRVSGQGAPRQRHRYHAVRGGQLEGWAERDAGAHRLHRHLRGSAERDTAVPVRWRALRRGPLRKGHGPAAGHAEGGPRGSSRVRVRRSHWNPQRLPGHSQAAGPRLRGCLD